jgi:hypothetical protein
LEIFQEQERNWVSIRKLLSLAIKSKHSKDCYKVDSIDACCALWLIWHGNTTFACCLESYNNAWILKLWFPSFYTKANSLSFWLHWVHWNWVSWESLKSKQMASMTTFCWCA